MPRNAVTKHILTIYIHACLVSSITRFRRQSITWTWYKLLRVKVQKLHFSWTKLGFADPYLRNLNFVRRCGMHIKTLPVPKTDFQLPAEVAVTWQKRPPYLICQYWLGVLGEYLSVTSQLMVESRNDRAENAWGLGCNQPIKVLIFCAAR